MSFPLNVTSFRKTRVNVMVQLSLFPFSMTCSLIGAACAGDSLCWSFSFCPLCYLYDVRGGYQGGGVPLEQETPDLFI